MNCKEGAAPGKEVQQAGCTARTLRCSVRVTVRAALSQRAPRRLLMQFNRRPSHLGAWQDHLRSYRVTLAIAFVLVWRGFL
ncbi:hypothetical protein E2562_019229 [Oryza meyeriana var. granulata]|uniref:Uncharacterized protein n=1 Tax=Oryza meyeriana var. granulata TaxID=110450 RepID=A0A6G1FAB4_9ORYZ|nr:hypothetical protein E2562_019229 [Oryza meyeriana var. granulata]